jgi:hypothetical protein
MRPVVIPIAMVTDRATRALITQWRNCHIRHRVASRRIWWRTKRLKASAVEKRRRKEKWELVARVLEIEKTIISWCAEETKHPSIYSTEQTMSTLHTLRRAYRDNRRQSVNLRGPARVRATKARIRIVAQIRALIREWMVALHKEIFPDVWIPDPLPLHATELTPRKLTRAAKRLLQEVS